MGLRVWLPLNGSLENQGLSNVTATNQGATLESAGKLGGCYTGRIDVSSSIIPTTLNGSEFTVAFWIYINEVPTSSSVAETYVMACGTAGTRTQFHIAIRANGAGFAFCFYSDDYTFYSTVTDKVEKWMHVVCAFKSNTQIVYVDGTKVGERATGGGLNVAANSVLNIYAAHERLNDFRLYDHALSVKEVRELARGLMVHYKLDDPLMESTTNYAPSPYKTSYTSYSPGWDTSKHPNAVSVNGWGGGYNSGVPSPTTGYHAMWNIINGIPTIVFQDHNSEISQTHRWLGINSSALSSTFVSNTPAGTQYCISFDMKTIDTLGGQVNVGVYYKTTSSSSNNFYDQNKTSTANTQLNIWQRKTLTFTRSSAFDGNTQPQYIYVYGHYGAEATVYVRNIQLEIKDHSTPYDVATRTASRVVDCSGFKYHGTIMNTLATNADTPRYDCSISFPGTSYIYRTSPSAQAMTISLWAKWNSIPSGQSVIYVDYKSKTGLGLMSAGILCSSCSLNSYTFSKANIVANTWYHFVIVCPSGSSNAARDLYINGVKQTATTSQSNWSYTIDELQLGKRSTTSDGFNGKLSDFRIYATALSDADIMDLYHTSAEIDRNGNYYSREVIEK